MNARRGFFGLWLAASPILVLAGCDTLWPSQCLFALLEERLEYRGESPSFSGIRIQLLQPVHDSCVVRAELLRQVVGLSTKGFGGFGILFLLGLIYLR